MEEYYSGGLFLPVLNGVTDGSLILILLFVVAGILGNDIFLYQVVAVGGQDNEPL